jgi:hypothetical protein
MILAALVGLYVLAILLMSFHFCSYHCNFAHLVASLLALGLLALGLLAWLGFAHVGCILACVRLCFCSLWLDFYCFGLCFSHLELVWLTSDSVLLAVRFVLLALD